MGSASRIVSRAGDYHDGLESQNAQQSWEADSLPEMGIRLEFVPAL